MNVYQYFKKIFQAAVKSAGPEAFIPENIRCADNRIFIKEKVIELSNVNNIIITGAGKASAQMAEQFYHLLPDEWQAKTRGLVVTKKGHSGNIISDRVKVLEASHPVPDQSSFEAAEKMIDFLKILEKKDVVFFFLSGGASALLEKPVEGVTFETVTSLNQELLNSSAGIQEINPVRQYFSQVKGGGLLQYMNPDKVINIVLSDVENDHPELIGSAPAFPVARDKEKVEAILKKYGLAEKYQLPKPVNLPEKKTEYFILASLKLALKASVQAAENNAEIKVFKNPEYINSKASEAAEDYLKLIKSKSSHNKSFLIIGGGEPVVKVTGKGKGGRNTHLTLEILLLLHRNKLHDIYFLSIGTDGTDGPTDAAGAWGSAGLVEKCLENGDNPESYLTNNDSYNFFRKYGNLIKTGPTGTNVNDLHLVLKISK